MEDPDPRKGSCQSQRGNGLKKPGRSDHLKEATGNGSVRSIVSIFAPVKGDSLDGDLPAYIESRQIVQYAGYTTAGKTIGDPSNQEITRIATALGWKHPAPPGPFDPLPLVICDAQGRRLLYEIPRSAIREVDIEHPQDSRLGQLALKWYAVPCVSSLILTIGGIDYPCAPFNGHYMSTEIANRDLADERRYDLLPQVADSLGIQRDADRDSLWRDRALTELNAAVLHSFRRDGVTIVDHHAASRQYMMFASREESAGRTPSADWSWIVPPQSASACPVYHLRMQDRHLVPNYYESRATDGARLGPSYDDHLRSRARQRWDTARKRWYRWWGQKTETRI